MKCNGYGSALLLLFAATSFAISKAQWISSRGMPRSDTSIAVGYHNSSIFILGGMKHQHQLTEFHLNTETFTDLGSSALPTAVWGYGQYYTQMEEVLYMIEPQGRWINTFNLKTQKFTENSISIPINVGSGGCLTSSLINKQLYIIGGELTPLTIQLPFDNNAIVNTNGDIFGRFSGIEEQLYENGIQSLSCIVHPTNSDILFSFGGRDGQGDLVDAILKMEIQSNNDLTAVKSLSYPNEIGVGSKAVIYDEDIIIVGGKRYDELEGYHYNLNDVRFLNPATDEVTLGDAMPYPSSGLAVISVDNKLFVFGSKFDIWLKYALCVNISVHLSAYNER